MGFLIDSSLLIDCERGRVDIDENVAGREEEEFYLSVVSASEILHGVHRAVDAATRARRSAFVEGVLARFPLIPIDLPTARTHAQLWAELSSRGRMIGLHDSWLAATCLAHGLVMVTGNLRKFERVPGLTVESWRREGR